MVDHDDREFEALLADTAAVRMRYRAESVADEPPAALDAAILAASRRAVGAGPTAAGKPRRFASQWAVPLSAAAVVVLATSLSFLVYEEHGTPSAPDMPRTAPIAPAPAEEERPQMSDAPDRNAAQAEPAPREQRSQEMAKRVAPLKRAEPATAPAAAPPPAREMAVQEKAAVSPPPAARVDEMPVESGGPPIERERQFSGAQEQGTRGASAPVAAAVPQTKEARAEAPGDRSSAALRDATGPAPASAPSLSAAPETASPAASAALGAAESVVRDRRAAFARLPCVQDSDAGLAINDPATWIARIRVLVEAGRLDDARLEVFRLRCRHPGLTLPADLPSPAPDRTCPAPPSKEDLPGHR